MLQRSGIANRGNLVVLHAGGKEDRA
jgi:hypothetical protein